MTPHTSLSALDPHSPVRLFPDDEFRIVNATDASKQLAFDLSAIASGTTRTLTAPNANGTVALLEHAQTFEGDQTVDGNLVLTGNARRIKGDFSNATHANRTCIQSSTPNGPTRVQLLPAPGGVDSSLQAWTNADTGDAERVYLQAGRDIKIAGVNLESIGTGNLTGWLMVFGINGDQHCWLTVADDALHLKYGQIAFPATQNASTDPNVLDDYEEGSFTPVLTFSVPGNLSVTCSAQAGEYNKIGRRVSIDFSLVTSAFTHSTASGALLVTGAPFACAAAAGMSYSGEFSWSGITKAGYTHGVARIGAVSTTVIDFPMSGSGVTIGQVLASDMPSGGSVIVRGNLSYNT